MSSYQMFTQSGINFYHAASAFQKFIRRGMENEALWYGTELYMSGYEEYVWFRLRVIVSEDIGLANPTLPAQVHALYQTYQDFKKKKNKHAPEKLQFIHALLLVIRSPKSRLVDNKLCLYMDVRKYAPQPPLPDFVFDMHTTEGRKKGRGNKHFFEESAAIVNANLDLVPDEFEFRDYVAGLYEQQDNEPKPPKPPKVSKAQEKLFEDIDDALEQRNLFDAPLTPDYDDSPY